MCLRHMFLTFTSLNLVLIWQLFYLLCSSIVVNTVIVTAGTFERNKSERFGASLKSDSTHHFFRNACTKSGSLRFSQFSGCWLILSVYILMSFDQSLCCIRRNLKVQSHYIVYTLPMNFSVKLCEIWYLLLLNIGEISIWRRVWCLR
jgi:hypothetical protein